MSTPERYRRHRFPIEVVEHCVWLYFRFSLSYRNIEEMMAVRGVRVTYETVREWCRKFGALYAAQLRKSRPRIGSKWHLDEVSFLIATEPKTMATTSNTTSDMANNTWPKPSPP